MTGESGVGLADREACTATRRSWRASASLAKATQLMVSHHRKMLPVVDDAGRLLGILDRADLLHAASRALTGVERLDAEDDED